MLKLPRTDAGQWRVLQAVVACGGYAQAALQLHRSQSSISYAIAKLQAQIGVPLLELDGRRMRLTVAGSALLREAVPLIDGLERLEVRAARLRQGWETEVRLAVDTLYPIQRLLPLLGKFAASCSETRVQLHEVVMSGADEALYGGQVDLAIATRVPQGFLGDWLFDAPFVAVAAPQHALHQLGRVLTLEDLRDYVQVVVRDSGLHEPRDAGWLGARQRWTVSKGETSLAAVLAGWAYAWLPEHDIAQALADGALRPLPLSSGQRRHLSMYLIQSDPERSGPATLQLGALIKADAATVSEDRADQDSMM
jgi:DNA-binding transcriptional LysR family regulator